MEYQNIYDYILLSKEHRQKHLCLDEKCICIGGTSTTSLALLAHYLNTTIPTKGIKIRKTNIHLCHACNNGGCSNPRHLYWGTPSENGFDSSDQRRIGGFTASNKLSRSSRGRFQPTSLTKQHSLF